MKPDDMLSIHQQGHLDNLLRRIPTVEHPLLMSCQFVDTFGNDYEMEVYHHEEPK